MIVSRRSSTPHRYPLAGPCGPLPSLSCSPPSSGISPLASPFEGGLHGPSTSNSGSCGSYSLHSHYRPQSFSSSQAVVPRRPSTPVRYSSSAGSSTGGGLQLGAIDSKIEQAMDLVKTHLMFAVREEVDLLRGKIVDLENTVGNLEAENAVLRQHVPEEIIRNLNLNN